MSIRKLLGTAACMVIIGVSAGVSYGQFQRLTAQVSPTPVAEKTETTNTLAPATAASGRVEFVAASTTNWTASETSGVTAPELTQPVAFRQVEPPLQQFTNTPSETSVRTAPSLESGIAALADPIVSEAAPDVVPVVAASVATVQPKIATQSRSKKVAVATPVEKPALGFTTASTATVTPGTLRRFRNTQDNGKSTASVSDPDGTFEQVFPPRTTIAAAPRAPRAGVSASTRAVQRQARFQRVWSTGVYR